MPALQVAMLMEEGGGINNSGIRPIDFMASVYSMFCQGRVHWVGCGQGPFVALYGGRNVCFQTLETIDGLVRKLIHWT